MKRMPRLAGPDLDCIGLWLDDAGADGNPAATLVVSKGGDRFCGPCDEWGGSVGWKPPDHADGRFTIIDKISYVLVSPAQWLRLSRFHQPIF